MKITLHIERLILDGLPLTSAQGVHVRAAVERELERMLAAGGLSDFLRTGGAVPRMPAPNISLGARPLPDMIGQQIAHSVHAGIGRNE